MKAKWILICILLLITYNFNYFADKIINDLSILFIAKTINSFIFGLLCGYSTVKGYIGDKNNY